MTAPAGADDMERQRRLEQAWRRRLLANPSDAAFRAAYDAVHAAMRPRPGREQLYEPSLTRVDRAFLKAAAGARRLLDLGAGNGRFALAAAAERPVVALDISGEALSAIQHATRPTPACPIASQIAGSPDCPIPSGTHPHSAFRIPQPSAPPTPPPTEPQQPEPIPHSAFRIPQWSAPALCQASALHLPFRAGTFDAVASLDLVEHLHPDTLAQHLAEVDRVLAPGGRYLLHTPSVLYGPTSLGLHLREYRLCEVERAARAAGFAPRWICLNLARLGWTGTAPGWIWPALRAWEALWDLAGRAGLRRAAGRWYAAGIPDVDVALVKPGA
jgi:SAM-dependent methyltransferase